MWRDRGAAREKVFRDRRTSSIVVHSAKGQLKKGFSVRDEVTMDISGKACEGRTRVAGLWCLDVYLLLFLLP